MLTISHEQIQAVYSMEQCIGDMKEAFRLYMENKTKAPVRTIIEHALPNANTLYMPSYIEGLEYETVKVVSIFPNNKEAGLPTLQGIILLTETNHGRHLATIEASGLTVLRTGAAAGVATEYLANKDATSLSILGCGAQARGQFEAVCSVRPITKVFLWNRSLEKSLAFKEEIESKYRWKGDVYICESANEAAANADVLCLSTKSNEALFDADVLRLGVHINAIGAYRPDLEEFGFDTLQRADQVWVDTIEGAKHEAGDLIQPIDSGLWSWEDVKGEVAELVVGKKAGRVGKEDITIYKSVGIAYMDTIAATKVYNLVNKQTQANQT
ncbi:ornithine cyclodeaminase [Halalkalibacter wakoensis JCM 9140]|uniref:Ornithine cyclodeaminase n=1 Tax=Halalkalibacter wakoensis JCM 9140 TaxID=1236970 RepID=W4Q6E9_9BACI|nr:hypothetical protein [Halalkalibacter wakoensis]GAE27572.1 ornithine cyclodeaminase [Halalkalibacter wakoensis JCM 9140]